MKDWANKTVTFFTAVFFLVTAICLFLGTINRSDVLSSLLTLTIAQVAYLLLILVCLVLLYEVIDQPLSEFRLETGLFRKPCRAAKVVVTLKVAWWCIAPILCVFGIVIPVLSILGAMPFSATGDWPKVAAGGSLTLLSSVYIYHLLGRPSQEARFIESLLQRHGAVSFQNRQEDHEVMWLLLDAVPAGSEILVTAFEEPRNPMHNEGYYYEQDFMTKWYSTVRAKRLRVTLLVLVNSDQDVRDLERRLEIVKDIPTFSLAFIVAPSLTVFADMLIVPNRCALIGFSDDRGMRNMITFSLLMSGAKVVSGFERLYKDVLLAEARYLKTFEGIDTVALQDLKAEVALRSRSSSRFLRGLFDFQSESNRVAPTKGEDDHDG